MLKNSAPLPSVRRLPLYLTVLEEFAREGKEWISTTDFSEVLFLKPIQVRKDLAHTGIIGKPKKGFKVDELISTIYDFLGWNNLTEAFLVGAGALGSALLGYGGFQRHGLDIVAAFDISPNVIGKTIHEKEILSLEKLPDLAKRMQVKLGIITVPSSGAQEVADRLVEAGISGIWNFSPIKLHVPDSVVVQREDISSGLAVLSVRLGRFD
ncbi:MAG: redox-sensing transcriptional repressor Rex [Spirochaetales bacterium]|uniref:Redox-sensing transcriptional repressor Rex n=1 Tax=Candidatus Thalassospirochaeta sargassi TaxID=3119039 RepID=A0AAJ1MJS3_9SPIO|nr:redox-sensing transcriptional repressor Rex [Spirochaetales bacterium]